MSIMRYLSFAGNSFSRHEAQERSRRKQKHFDGWGWWGWDLWVFVQVKNPKTFEGIYGVLFWEDGAALQMAGSKVGVQSK